MSDYRIEPVDLSEGGLARVEALLAAAFERHAHLQRDYVRWLYVENPVGAAIGWNALAGDILAAHYVVVPITCRMDGHAVAGTLSLNTATHPEHQRKGLYVKLATLTYDSARAQGYEFVAGVGNRQSTHGLIERLGWQDMGTLAAEIGIGPLRREPYDGPPPEWERTWTPETLGWRMARPGRTYRATRAGRDGLVEVIGDSGYFHVPILLGKFLPETVASLRLPHARSGYPRLYVGADEQVRPSRWRFVPLPARFRPAPLNLAFKDLSDGKHTLRTRRIRFQAIDFDVF